MSIGILSTAAPALGVLDRSMNDNLAKTIVKSVIFGIIDAVITAIIAGVMPFLGFILALVVFLVLSVVEIVVSNNKEGAINLLVLGVVLSLLILILKPLLGVNALSIFKFSTGLAYLAIIPLVDTVLVILGAVAYNIYDKLLSV